MDKEYITISEAAKLVGVSVDTIRRWEKKGLIKSTRNELNYRVFNLKELKTIQNQQNGISMGKKFEILKDKRKNGFKVIELFAGAGGTALGFENVGFEHVCLNENNKPACQTLRTNRPDWNVIEEDVHVVDFSKMKADVVEAGFPCQSFSYAGKGLGFGDTRGTLFKEFIRCVEEVKPMVAMGENVKGLLKHDNGKTIATIVHSLESAGYKVVHKVLRAQYHDVPQKRERLIIIGIRNDLNLRFLFPKEKDYVVTVGEALKDCPKSDGQEYSEKKKKVLSMVPPGGYWRDLPIDIQKEYMAGSYYLGGGKTGMARRLSWDEPSLTLTCSPAQKQTERCHPKFDRPLTVREYARIQSFPDEWEFAGSIGQQYKQIGNAVPVNFGYHIAKCIQGILTDKFDPSTTEEIIYDDFIGKNKVKNLPLFDNLV